MKSMKQIEFEKRLAARRMMTANLSPAEYRAGNKQRIKERRKNG